VTYRWRAAAVAVAAAAVLPLQPWPSGARQVQSCVVWQPLQGGEAVMTGTACQTRFSPASTFKIPHALVALETGVVTKDTLLRWDGTRYEQQAKWNHDHTVISALRPSVLWVFQRIAPKIGSQRMRGWLERLSYGNHDTSGAITEYWINGRLTVSAIEQVAFLRRFYQGDVPAQPQHIAAVRAGLEQRPGTVENALGVHRLRGDWRESALNSKTGATTTSAYGVSWLIGLLTTPSGQYVFASVVSEPKGRVASLAASELAITTFLERGLLPRPVAAADSAGQR
jgi:beta-lactamase class D